ncbi:Tetratricopeptide-like helical domain superfamily [Fusarium oxysporum f. sp. vasinfectum]|nr:Tetratricopeptide-like helical domain superfamily [Fusarium oxysporum f. sp. vasinfectum]
MDPMGTFQQPGIDKKDMPNLLMFFAVEAYNKFQTTGDVSDIHLAVTVAQLALMNIEGTSSHIISHLNNLGVFLEKRYERIGETADLDEAIGLARRAIDSIPGDHPERAACLINLGTKLCRRYERTGKMADLNEAIELMKLTVDSTPGDHANRATCLNNLAVFLEKRYERIGETADLDEAIGLARRAIDSIPGDHPERAAWLSNLGTQLCRRYERTGKMADLDEAIGLARRAIDVIPDDHPNRAAWLINLGTQLCRRYERTGKMADLNEAIGLARQAVNSTMDDHPDRPVRLNNLGNIFENRYERTGNMADLHEAICIAEQAVASTPDDHPDRTAWLSNLATKLSRRYERTGKMADLDEAISIAEQAVDAIPGDHPNRVTCFNNLGNRLSQRYERTGEMADLEEAICLARRVTNSIPGDHPERVAWLNNLGLQLKSRYDRIGNMADLEEAIGIARQVVDSTPDDHPDRAGRLNNLGISFSRRYKQTGKMVDLDEAIELARQAVNSTPDDHPDRAAFLNNLGSQLQSRYKRTEEMKYLEEAIKIAKQAVDLTPDDHPDRAAFLNNLGSQLQSRFERTGETRLLEEASLTLRDAWHCQTAIPFHRVQAGARCLKLFALQHKTDIAISLGENIIDLLPSVNTRLFDRSDQQFVLSTFSGVAADLCALHLQSNQPADALRFLEKGRAVIIGQLIDARSDLSILEQQHPDIAHRYQQLRDEVNTPLRQVEQGAIQRHIRIRRRQALTELDVCIQEIRGIAGHERFMLGQEPAEMQECAQGGSIVVVNVTVFRSDAIIVTSTAIKSLNLPQLAAEDAISWLDKKWKGRRSERAQKNKEYLEYLSWLWETCVKQILDEVCPSHDSENSLPRIWWIGTGLASSMPFHAAGKHAVDSTEHALSRAVSSYTPSIKALTHARYRARTTESTQGSVLIATMPTTPGALWPDLPGVQEEKSQLIDMASDHLPITHLELPSAENVVESLRNCCIAHFACHGDTDHLDPSKSGLILQNQGEEDRLTVQKVSELNLRNARIAYLSACSTAENKAARLLDEVIHVVSGFQVAGFPHVIGCLWPSIDRICVDVAGRFYVSLLRGKTDCWDDREVASALRVAVMEVRKTELRMPLVWAQFVHFGA